jgi:prepilin peptidase CpaA
MDASANNGAAALVLAGLLAAAVLIDMRNNRIPNSLCLLLMATGVFLHVSASGLIGASVALGGLLVGGIVLLPFYIGGGMAAGDVKLMAAVGTLLGPWAALVAGSVTLIAGGVMAAGVLGCRTAVAVYAGEQMSAAIQRHRRSRFPYAAAIAGGTLIALWSTSEMTLLGGRL